MFEIRPETPTDYAAIGEVTKASFESTSFGYNGEAELITELRNCEKTLSLVASANGGVVGHALFTPVEICTNGQAIIGMGLGPMSVVPNKQRNGIGSKLVKEGIRILTDNRCRFIVVLGHSEYYPRFGFQPATAWSISHGFEGIPQDLFFIRCHDQDLLLKMSTGKAYYNHKFGPQHIQG